jgi:hypothetical protein
MFYSLHSYNNAVLWFLLICFTKTNLHSSMFFSNYRENKYRRRITHSHPPYLPPQSKLIARKPRHRNSYRKTTLVPTPVHPRFPWPRSGINMSRVQTRRRTAPIAGRESIPSASHNKGVKVVNSEGFIFCFTSIFLL